MTHPDRANLERVVPGPDYPERPRSAAVFPWTLAMLAIVAFVLIVVAAASRGAPEPTPQSPAEPAGVGREGNTQALLGAPQPWVAQWKSTEPTTSDSEVAGSIPALGPSGAPPTVDRYRGTATWYCLSGSSACTAGYGPDDLVAAIDTDLGFAKGDELVVRYRDRSVTVTVVDVCGCAGERLIDLTSGAFARLAPLGHGVIPVTIELAGGPTLPPTDGGKP